MKVAYGVLLIGLVATFVALYRVHENIKASDTARFDRLVSDAQSTIDQGITRCVDQAYNMRALFAASQDVSWEEWNAYLLSMTIRHSELGIRTLGYLERVTSETLPTFLRERAAAGQPNFRIVPEGERAIYYPSVYLTHFDSTADVIIGLDHAVKPERLAMINRAIDQNRATITEKAFFMGRDGTHTNFGAFVYLPVYRHGAATGAVAQRREAVKGVIYISFVRDTLPGILFDKDLKRQIGFEVYDGDETNPQKLLYGGEHAAGQVREMTRKVTIQVLNRQWTLVFFTTPEFHAATPHHLRWFTLTCGLIVSGLLFGLTLVQTRARTRAEEDAAQLHRSEMALATERERLAVTLESIAEGVITTDASGRIESINREAERLTGVEKKDAQGKPLASIFNILNEQSREPRVNLVTQVLQTGADVDVENYGLLIAADGTERIIVDTAALIRDRNGRNLGAVLVFRDVTEKRRTEAEMLKESKLESVGLLAGGIAHDFNNILAAIIGNISLIRMSVHSTEKMLDRLASLEKAANRARDLTQQLLTFAKGGAPIRKWTQLPELVKDACQFALHGSNIECEYSLPDNIWPVELDEGQFRQAWNHLVMYAMQQMPQGGRIEVKVENVELTEGFLPPLPAGNYVKLSIRDHGEGIKAEHLPRIFEPYFSTKNIRGLGLATAYSVVRKHEGQIRVESTIGVGTVFQVYLPASQQPSNPAAHHTNQKDFFGHGRVLVMDDEIPVLEVAREMLRICGYEVETVKDGEEAIDRYMAEKKSGDGFDAVIMDLTIPNGMGGREAIRRLKELDPAIKAIVSSGYSFDPVMANYKQYGFHGIIPKPYRLEDLRTVLREVLEQQGKSDAG